MSKTVEDITARTQALAPDQSFIIQAPAGSGKTGLLIQRYLRLLALVDEPEEIIAITFTRKAAAEMQGRILNALDAALHNKPPTEEHGLITYELAQAALQRDLEKNWNISENPARLRIQTIDSLCANLTRQMPMLSRLGTQPETLDNAEPLYQQAAINTLAELESGEGWSDAIANLVFHLDNDLPRIKKLIVDMLRKRDQWLAYVVHEHDRNDMEQALVRLIEEQLATAKMLFSGEFEDELMDVMHFAAANKKENDPDNPVSICEDLSSLPGKSANDLNYWRGIGELLLTRTGGWRKRFDKRDGFPAAGSNKLEADERARKKKQIQALITELQKVEGLQHVLAAINVLPPTKFTDDEWLIVNALCQLLKLAAVQLRIIFAERNQMDFIGVAESAIEALGTETNPTELAMNLDYLTKHILVDEFQDISINQYRLIQGLTREWSMDDGRSLFLVGDPMQSIYRFREAEVGIFIKTYHEARLGNIPLVPLKLKVNFRSQQGLVTWVNESFKSIFPEQDDVITGAVSFSEAIGFDKNASGDNVRVYPLYGRALKKEAQHVSGIIQEIKNKNPEDTIALLVRSRSHLIEIVPEIRKAGISFKAIEIEGLASQSAIQDLLALTRALLFPADSVAWLACLRAPWCGLKLESLYKICHENKHKTVWECLSDNTLIKTLDKQELARVKQIKTVFEQAIDNRHRLSVRLAVESLWCQLGGPATLQDKTEMENCNTYLELLEPLDSGGTIEDLETLFENMEQLYAAPDTGADDSLQVMTIHKAKGLEFDHVILPGLGRAPRSGQGDLMVWLLRPGKNRSEDLILAPIREAGNQQAPIYDYINKTDKAKQEFEDSRLLYVATTRTKKTLHLLGSTSLKEKNGDIVCEPSSRSLLAHLWPMVKEVYEKYLPVSVEQNNDETWNVVNQENRRLTAEWTLPDIQGKTHLPQTIQDEDTDTTPIEFEWAGETIKHIGSIVHSAIQRIAEETMNSWSQGRLDKEHKTFEMALQQLNVPKEEQEDALQRILTALKNMMNDERGKWILSDKHKFQKNEYAITGLVNGKITNVVLDRTFVDEDGIRWIIDYKTSRHEGPNLDDFLDRERERYQEQLEKYAVLMRELGETNIKLGLYFPLLQGWREWEYI